MRWLFLTFVLLGFCASDAYSQVVADDRADLSVMTPAFAPGTGPVIGVDSAHHNYHTIANRYAPFATLLRNDGFRVVDFDTPLSVERLSDIKVLVISNALPADVAGDWKIPAHSAFTPIEIAALKEWVEDGGSLLLIADHLPFAGSVRDVAHAFGIEFEDGVVRRDPIDQRRDIFTTAAGSLRDDVITRGRNAAEVITALETFTGSAFRAPADARPIIVFPSGYMIHDCGLPCPAGVAEHEASGYLQGAVMQVGRGRLAVFGEAAMFSAQIIPSLNPPFHFGFNAPGAEQNKQFILNLIRWSAGVLPP